MDAIAALKDRRSVRSYKPEKVSHQTMEEIMEVVRWAPSWANFQIARYTLVDDPEVIRQLATDGVKGFSYNIKTLENAPGVAVLSFVEGKSGKLDPEKADFDPAKTRVWEAFDAGISCQTFCLAAHAKGVGTCIFGVIDEDSISGLVKLPSNETVAALIVYGYETEHPAPTPRKAASEIVRYI